MSRTSYEIFNCEKEIKEKKRDMVLLSSSNIEFALIHGKIDVVSYSQYSLLLAYKIDNCSFLIIESYNLYDSFNVMIEIIDDEYTETSFFAWEDVFKHRGDKIYKKIDGESLVYRYNLVANITRSDNEKIIDITNIYKYNGITKQFVNDCYDLVEKIWVKIFGL